MAQPHHRLPLLLVAAFLLLVVPSCAFSFRIACIGTPGSVLSAECLQLLRLREEDDELELQTLFLTSQSSVTSGPAEKELKKFKKLLGEEFCELSRRPIIVAPEGSVAASEAFKSVCEKCESLVLPDNGTYLKQILSGVLMMLATSGQQTRLSQIVASWPLDPDVDHTLQELVAEQMCREAWAATGLTLDTSGLILDLVASSIEEGTSNARLRDKLIEVALQRSVADARPLAGLPLSLRMHSL